MQKLTHFQARCFAKQYATGPFSYVFHNPFEPNEIGQMTAIKWGFTFDGEFVMLRCKPEEYNQKEGTI